MKIVLFAIGAILVAATVMSRSEADSGGSA